MSATWLEGVIDAVRARRVAERLAARMVNGDEGERRYWCSPYCPRVDRSMAARSRHRAECEHFVRFASEARRALGEA